MPTQMLYFRQFLSSLEVLVSYFRDFIHLLTKLSKQCFIFFPYFLIIQIVYFLASPFLSNSGSILFWFLYGYMRFIQIVYFLTSPFLSNSASILFWFLCSYMRFFSIFLHQYEVHYCFILFESRCVISQTLPGNVNFWIFFIPSLLNSFHEIKAFTSFFNVNFN